MVVKSYNSYNRIKIMDVKGSVVYQSEQRINSSTFEVDLGHLSKGVYLVQWSSEAEIIQDKLILR